MTSALIAITILITIAVILIVLGLYQLDNEGWLLIGYGIIAISLAAILYLPTKWALAIIYLTAVLRFKVTYTKNICNSPWHGI